MFLSSCLGSLVFFAKVVNHTSNVLVFLFRESCLLCEGLPLTQAMFLSSCLGSLVLFANKFYLPPEILFQVMKGYCFLSWIKYFSKIFCENVLSDCLCTVFILKLGS